MKKGIRAGDAPIGVDVLESKSYYWCSCGLSKKQPFCDSANHRGTDFKPLKFSLDKKKETI